MIVTASYGIGANATLTTAEVAGYSVTPSVLLDGTTKVTITYSEMGETRTAEIPVTVTHKLESIAITTNPTKVTYEYGDTLVTTGMVVTATYSDTKTAAVAGSVSPTTLNTVGTQVITVTYTENGVTKTTTFPVTVERKSVAKPTWKANLNYTGSSQAVNTADKWNNFNTNAMSIGGTTSGTNAGTYTATFTLGSNYRWVDGTTTALNINWVINKVAPTFSFDKTSVAINASARTQTVTITTNSDGAISFTPTSISGLTISKSGKVITITGDGSTKVNSTTITVSIAAGTNWTAPANKTFTVSATYWEWGTETAIGDAAWWAGLKAALPGMTTAQREALVGKKKKVTLSSATAGWNANVGISMVCVAADVDANNSLTFQTEGCSPAQAAFSSSNALWANSVAKTTVEQFATRSSAAASILSVTKLTSDVCNNSKTNAANIETTGKGFLPSEFEMGIGGTYSSSDKEGTKGRTLKAYQYYNSNSRRIKYYCTADGNITTNTYWYWERSRYYYTDYSYRVCVVDTNGNAGGNSYFDTGGRLAPAFVIG